MMEPHEQDIQHSEPESSQGSEIRARKLENEFNLENKSKMLDQFIKFSRESIDDILNSTKNSNISFSQDEHQAKQNSSCAQIEKKVSSFHESWHQFSEHIDKVTKSKPKQNHATDLNKVQDVTSSCPASVFKNYSNVFAEITKSVIGEIDNSDQSEDNQSFKEEPPIRNCTSSKIERSNLSILSELDTNKPLSKQYKFSMNRSSNSNSKEEISQAFDQFFNKYTQDLDKSQQQNNQENIFKEQHDLADENEPPNMGNISQIKQEISNIQEDFDGENLQSHAVSNKKTDIVDRSTRKNQQVASGQPSERQKDSAEKSVSNKSFRGSSVKEPSRNLFKSSQLKSPSKSPNRHLNSDYSNNGTYSSEKKKRTFSNILLASNQSSLIALPNSNCKINAPQASFIVPDNDQREVTFEHFFSGRILGNIVRLYNPSQSEAVTLQLQFDCHSQSYSSQDISQSHGVLLEGDQVPNSQLIYDCWFIEDPSSKELVKQSAISIPPSKEVSIVVVLKAPFNNQQPLTHIITFLNLKSQSQSQQLLLRGKLCCPQLHCLLNKGIPTHQEKILKLEITKAKQSFKLPFKNVHLQYPIDPLKIQFGLVDIEYYRQLASSKQPFQVDYKMKQIVMPCGIELKLKNSEMVLRGGAEKKLKIKSKVVKSNSVTSGVAILVGRLIDSDLTYFFIVDITKTL